MMNNLGPVLILIGNCCLVPVLFFFLGYAWALGWIRSPLKIDRRAHHITDPHDPFYTDDQL